MCAQHPVFLNPRWTNVIGVLNFPYGPPLTEISHNVLLRPYRTASCSIEAVMAAGAAYQGRVIYQNRAMLCEVDVDGHGKAARVRPYPIRYEMTGHDRWTLDTSVFPKSYPSYLESLHINL